MSFTSRRTFLKASGAFAAAASVGIDRLAAAPPNIPVGIQLYSVRSLLTKAGSNPTDEQLNTVLGQVRGAGYTVCEAAGYYGRQAPDLRKALDNAGLRCLSTHHGLGQLRQQLDELIDYGHVLGLEFMVCSSAGGQHRDPNAKGELTVDDWYWVCDQYNQIGEKVKNAGMTFGFHNHTGEYATIDGVWIYGELMKRTDPRYVVFEMDAGWVAAAGYDPVTMLKKAPERFQLMHVKDEARGPDGKFVSTPVGRGKMDYRPIMAAATGLKQYFVEQEQFDMPVIEEITIEAQYMKSLNV